jgi:hypothetical protein
MGSSLSYTNVTSVGTPATISGDGRTLSPSQSSTLSSGQLAAQAFAGDNTLTSPSGGTNSYGSSGSTQSILINTATTTTTFTATIGSSAGWAASAVILS